jgi:GNAT superfamily N-acetyltransferase
LEKTDVLSRDEPLPRTPAPGGIALRPITSDEDWAQVLDLQIETGIEEGYNPAVYNAFLEKRLATRRAQITEGWGQWFGAFENGALVADLGIFTDGKVARYQSVQTRASHRKRGLARALLSEASHWAKAHSPEARLVILADEGAPSAQIYRRAGFDLSERLIAAVKAPPEAKA